MKCRMNDGQDDGGEGALHQPIVVKMDELNSTPICNHMKH